MENSLHVSWPAKLVRGSTRFGCRTMFAMRPWGSVGLRALAWLIVALAVGAVPAAQALQLTVAWDNNATGQTGFKVERSSDGQVYAEIATVGASVTTYTDTGLAAGSYWYRVRAYNDSTVSDYSNVAAYQYTDSAPTITTQPSSQSIVSGGSVSFSVAANGSPAPSFQWSKDGVALSGATSSTLTLSNVTSASAGSYTAVATNTAGTSTSNPAILTVTAPAPSGSAPAFTTQPASQSATWGNNVTLTVAVTGSPTPTLQWQRNAVAISGATAATLTLTSVTSANAGTYTVVATNASGSVTSTGAVLTIAGIAPSIATQPVSQSVTLGANISFSLAANGTPAPTYQWRKDGVAISGGTTATLNLMNVTSADAATYTAVVTNSVGSVTSANATLTVTAPAPVGTAPTISSQPVGQTIAAGGNVSLAIAASGSPAPTYQWRKDGVAISGATQSTLSLTSVTTADVATYTVVVTNSVGSVTSANATLTVTAPAPVGTAPTISSQPVGQTIAAGGNISLAIAASGSPAPTYQWRKDGVAISGGTTATLNLMNVTSADAAGYTVVVANDFGSVTSAVATLIVTAAGSSGIAPSITTQPVSQSATAGTYVSLSVSASGTPAPTYQWRKDGFAISGATSSTLTIASAASSDAGTYTVVATNASGSVVSSGALVTITTPNPGPQNPVASASRLANASIRAIGGQGDQTLIVGFVVSGGDKSVMLRAIGPGLATFTSATVFADPKLTIYDGSKAISSNDNWGGVAAIRDASKVVGAFSLADDSKDAAIIAKLSPKPYTFQVNGSGAGMALAEIYDLESAGGKLVNISARADVGTGDGVLIAGFVITGDAPKQVLIRAAGPVLSGFGVTGVLARPQLTLYRGGSVIYQNEGWGGSSAMTEAFSKVGAFPLTDPNSKDAALLVTLDPGAYSAIVSGANGTGGVALVEVYDVN